VTSSKIECHFCLLENALGDLMGGSRKPAFFMALSPSVVPAKGHAVYCDERASARWLKTWQSVGISSLLPVPTFSHDAGVGFCCCDFSNSTV